MYAMALAWTVAAMMVAEWWGVARWPNNDCRGRD
jgi:hypothetical protein